MWTEVKRDLCVYVCRTSTCRVVYSEAHLLHAHSASAFYVQALPLCQSLFGGLGGGRGDLGLLLVAVKVAENLLCFFIVLFDFNQSFLDVLQRFLLIGFVDSAGLIFPSTVMLDLLAVIFHLLQTQSR
jgi:hypothetical protein